MHNQHKLELNTEQKERFHCEKVADIFPEHYIINVKNFDDIAKISQLSEDEVKQILAQLDSSEKD